MLIYCLAYFLAIAAASGLKYLSVIIQTQINQQALVDMRKKLYNHIISLPLNFFRKTQPGLVVNSLVSELNVPSNFVGMAIAVPVINILTLLPLPPIFILGGYLAINGRLDLGALVAFLSAQEKLYTPWKELIEFYQVYQNATVTYSRTMKYFDSGLEYDIEPVERAPSSLTGNMDIIQAICGGASDFLDGWIARRCNLTSWQ